MPELMILDECVVSTAYRVDLDDEASAAPQTAIPLARWLTLQAAGSDLSETGVILNGDSDLTPLQPHLAAISFVAVNFPKYTDGRSYSHARRLRALWDYQGPIIAFGDVLRDQLTYMSRCGINGFILRADQDPHACLAAFELYRAHYQYN